MQRSLIRALAAWVFGFGVLASWVDSATAANPPPANPPIDNARVATARALAGRYWRDSGLEKLPGSYAADRFEKAVNGEDDPYNIVAAIAVATLRANPDRKDSVLKYLNDALLPYAISHKAQYLCLISEALYNATMSTDEMRARAGSGPASDGLAIAFIDYAYFLIKTEPQRKKLELTIPADNGIAEAVSAFENTLTPKGGALITPGAVRLGCEH